jgi:pSer/pThr/pTyr-binding forkhead associated (FHA) protein
VATAGLTLEIIEGPGAGRRVQLSRPLLIGRADDTDLVLEDGQASRHHARITPESDLTARVEDLGSVNGTFVNDNELHGPAVVDAGDRLLIGVTVIEVHSGDRRSARLRVPPALARAPKTPEYVNPEVIRIESGQAAGSSGHPELDRYLDVRVRRRAQLAPVALFAVIALALIIYFALR